MPSFAVAAALAAVASTFAPTVAAKSTPRYGPDGTTPLYKMASAPVADRVNDLISRMTLQEKVNQMLNPVGNQDGPGNFAVNATYLIKTFGSTGLGTVYAGVGGCPEPYTEGWQCHNWVQSQMINTSRLGIPISFIGETLCSGTGGATIFPQPIGRGCSFNVDLESQIGLSIARQARLGGVDRGLSPVLQVDTDPRFGRFEESYGEDPFLVSTMGVAVALSLQGGNEGPNQYLPDFTNHVSIEAKHALAYGYGGRDWYGVDLTDRTLYDVYAKPWHRAIRQAGLRGAMMAHEGVNGEPLHGSRTIMTDVLRDWFGGGDNGTGSYMLLASDWGNVEQIPDFGSQADKNHGAAMAAWAGLDNEMCPPPLAMQTLVDSVNNGLIAEAYIDRAAGNNLREKFASGLFDGYWQINGSALQTELDLPSDRALAYQAASESLVLLKNDNNVLPLTGLGTTIKKVAVVGPLGACNATEGYPCLAQQGMGGHYTNYGANIITLGNAINATIANNTYPGLSYSFVPGAHIDSYDDSGIAAAVASAQDADVVLVAVGDSIPIGQGTCTEMHDTDSVDLPGSQLDLIYALTTQLSPPKPIVVLLFTCRPVTFGAGPSSKYGPNNALLDNLHAVIAAWRPGEEAGNAVWDTLRGINNPNGRLTQNWVRNVGAVKSPANPYLQYRGASGGAYVTEPASPLFSFGWGLQYTKYTVNVTTVSPDPYQHVFNVNDTITINGYITSDGPAGKLSLLAFYYQNAPTKWARYENQLTGFGKFVVPANAGKAGSGNAPVPYSVVVKVSDWDAFEPATGDYEVQTGAYTVSLRYDLSSTNPVIGWVYNINVTGTYTFAWNFNDM